MLIKKGKGRPSFSEHKCLTVQSTSFKKQKKRTLRGCRHTIIPLGVLKPVRVLPCDALMGAPKCFYCACIIWNLGHCQSMVWGFLDNLTEIWFANLKFTKLISGVTGWIGSSIMCWISHALEKLGCKVIDELRGIRRQSFEVGGLWYWPALWFFFGFSFSF